MSDYLHLKDDFGNDVFFGDTDQIRLPALPHVDKTYLNTIRDIPLSEDDVIVIGYPKSGNNWIHHMVSMLKGGTTDQPPFVDFESGSIAFLEGHCKDMKLRPTHNAIFSHLPFRFLPRDVLEKKVKIVYLTRNPKDVFVSFYCHLHQTKLPLGYGGTWPQFFSLMLEQGYWYGDVLNYLKEWQSALEANPDHPIFPCNYEETKQDTLAQVERLNQFLGTGRSRQMCQEIVKTCQLDNMHMTRGTGGKISEEMMMWKEGSSTKSLFRKGIVGDWKNWFTVAQNEQFDNVYRSKMADYKYSFCYE